jgi:hypothetical protein
MLVRQNSRSADRAGRLRLDAVVQPCHQCYLVCSLLLYPASRTSCHIIYWPILKSGFRATTSEREDLGYILAVFRQYIINEAIGSK